MSCVALPCAMAPGSANLQHAPGLKVVSRLCSLKQERIHSLPTLSFVAAIGTTSVNTIELYGAGNSTIKCGNQPEWTSHWTSQCERLEHSWLASEWGQGRSKW